MSDKTYEGFKVWVAVQDSAKNITHSMWGKCAVGEYVNGYPSEDGPEHCRAMLFATEQLPEAVWQMLWQERPKTYALLHKRLQEIG